MFFFYSFHSWAFVGQIVWLLSLWLSGHSHRYSKQIFFFSSASDANGFSLLTLIPLLFTKKSLVTPYHKIAADTMTFLDILFVKLSKFSSGVSDFFPLPYKRSLYRLTGTSRAKSSSSCQTDFLIIRMLFSNLSLREPARVYQLFRIPSPICVVFKFLNCLRFLFSQFSVLMTDWFLFVLQFFLALNTYGVALPFLTSVLFRFSDNSNWNGSTKMQYFDDFLIFWNKFS